MTPNRSGKWKDMIAVTDPFAADFVAIMDGENCPIPHDRAIYYGEHPDCLPAFRRWENKQALVKLPLDKYLNPGEWWIDYDYDTISKMPYPQKNKKLFCSCTLKTSAEMYLKRVRFLEKIAPKYSGLELYGRPKANYTRNPILNKYHKGELGNVNISREQAGMGLHTTGKEIIRDYKYSLEFDNGLTTNYFSERFYDALFMWTMPVYWGSSNVHQFIPENAFRYVDLDNPSEVDRIIKLAESDFAEKHIEDMSRARDLLLNKYQIWPYIYDVCTHISEYQNGTRRIEQSV